MPHPRLVLVGALAALLPGAARAQSASPTYLGDVRGWSRVPGGIRIDAAHGAVLVESVAGVGARVRVRFGDAPGAFAVVRSNATGDAPPALGAATATEAGDTIAVSAAEGVRVLASRHPLRLVVRDAAGRELVRETLGAATRDGQVAHYVADPARTAYLALGEQPLPSLVLNGGVYPFWNTDHYAYLPGATPIYSTFPFYLALSGGAAHGVLYDDPYRGEMDLAGRLPGSIAYEANGAIDGELRWYVVPGPGIDSVLARYTRLTGRLPLPPRWALGYQQSRYSYFPDSMVSNVAREFRRRDIPLDAIYLDIDYMNGYRVFTWSPERFPHAKALLDTLGRLGIRTVTIVDPGVKIDSAFPVWQQGMARHAFATTPDGRPAVGTVWPGLSNFPDFSRPDVRAWWGGLQRALVDSGVRGIWNDMNEPSSFTGGTLSDAVMFDGGGHPASHAEYHNQYGHLMGRASYEGLRRLRPDQRPLVIVRAGYTGVQRYSAIWTGDNNSTWIHLRMSIPMILSLGLTGEPFAGSDIGGFTGAPSADLYARWIQSATLVPFFRTHAATGTPRREPWSFGPEYERAIRASIRLRYRLIPAVYTAFDQHARTGSPVVRPVFWPDAAADTLALQASDEYLLGDHLLAAPVVDSGAVGRAVYLPAGRWYRLGTDSAYTGGARITVSAPDVAHDGADTTGLRGLPVFARAGAVIPMQPALLHEGARTVDTLTLHVFPGQATSQLYEDAGDGYAYQQGQYRRTTFTTTASGTITLARQGVWRGAQTFAVVLHAAGRPSRVTVDGRAVRVQWDAASRQATFTMPATATRVVVGR